MVKLVIFDWDGTLFDSIDRICKSMLLAAEQVGAPARQQADIQNIIGLSLDKAVDTVWPDIAVSKREAIMAHYKAIYVQADQTPPTAYDGVYALLKQLKKSGITMAVATGKTRRGLDRVMALTETQSFFATSRCADEALSKPNPLMLEQILHELNVPASQAIMVGDTEYDLNMATAAGMQSIGVSYGAHEVSRLEACQPKAVINSADELIAILGISE